MRIGFDAVRALRNSTGLGGYARRVLAGVLGPDAGLGLEGRLYSPAPPRPAFAGLPAELAAPLELPGAGWRTRGARTLWRTFRLGRRAARDGVALFHGLSHELPRDLPRTGIPGVVSFLDLLWERYPGLFPPIDRRSYAFRYRWSAEHAGAIVAASAETRRELLARYDVDPSRTVVIPPPADARFAPPARPEERERVRRRWDLPGEFVLSVGTLEARKNQRTLIRALRLPEARRVPPLVLVGRDRGTQAALLGLARESGVLDRVLIRNGVPAEDLPALVQCAAVCLYPSVAEGFGLPIVEALTAGVPVISSEGGCFREAGGPETLYVPATDAAAWALALRRVLEDSALAAGMRAAGRLHAARFEARALAARMARLYRAVLEGAPLPNEDSRSTLWGGLACGG